MARRRSIYLDGFSHKNPIPAASVLDRIVVSGIIYVLDPGTGKAAVGLDAQCRLMFEHFRAVLEAAGATPDDVLVFTWDIATEVIRYLNEHGMGPVEYYAPLPRPRRLTGWG